MLKTRKAALWQGEMLLKEAAIPDAALDAQWLLSHVTGEPRLWLLALPDEPLAEEAAARYDALLARRAAGEPLQYIVGETDFMGHTLRVDARALIPRNDTEALAEAIIARLRPGLSLLDIGTGSGALAIAAKLACPDAFVTGADISPDALALARENGQRLGANIEWVQSDLFAALPGRAFDIIASNPPYIQSDALPALQREVLREPHLALDGGADGLDFYRNIIFALPGRLSGGGALLFEVGDGQAAQVAAWMRPLFSSVEILRDLAGLERVVTGDSYAG
ncbi:MAG: peptide chain release factor N(5)-glutamine methyltransferase [Oscillospiraceae bacterium]|jgi:release factor glutamine methyltransferase|nr:peptide chain release factor N(5)-glutamine methyltransferase [Oscillospiraceae bacterium]